MQKIQKASLENVGINKSGWISTLAAGPVVDIGAHVMIFNGYAYVLNDYLGRMEVTWYVKFKNRRVV